MMCNSRQQHRVHARRAVTVMILAAALSMVFPSLLCAQQLKMPAIPTVLKEPRDRAAYLIEHYWDNMDFNDSSLTKDMEFMELSFVNFLSVFPIVDEPVLRNGVKTLLTKASTDESAYKVVAMLADKYLYDANSPMLNEGYYALFLEHLLKSRIFDEGELSRLDFQYSVTQKNMVGTVATDFGYVTREGKRNTLHGTEAERMLLIFYDPECGHCAEIMTMLYSHTRLNQLIKEGKMNVLAVDAEEDRNEWKRHLPQMPEVWTVGFATSEIQPRRLYYLRAMPTLFLLDKEKRVIVKDLRPEQLNEFL